MSETREVGQICPTRGRLLAFTLKEHAGDGLSSRLSTVLLVQGILFFVLASLETFGFYAAWRVCGCADESIHLYN